MAGLGRRTFAAGEVLTAGNVMGYLQDQAVMNFAGTAARGSAIGTAVAEGMVSYLADSNVVQAYDGSAWNSLAYASAVPSANSIGLVPIVPSTVRVSGGTATANSLGKVSFTSATSIAFDNVFSSTYSSYRIVFTTSSVTVSTATYFRFTQTGTATSSSLWYGAGYYYGINGAGVLTSTNAGAEIYTNSVVSTGFTNLSTSADISINKNNFISQSVGFPNNAGGAISYGLWNASVSAYDGFRINVASGNMTGTLQVYGLKEVS